MSLSFYPSNHSPIFLSRRQPASPPAPAKAIKDGQPPHSASVDLRQSQNPRVKGSGSCGHPQQHLPPSPSVPLPSFFLQRYWAVAKRLIGLLVRWMTPIDSHHRVSFISPMSRTLHPMPGLYFVFFSIKKLIFKRLIQIALSVGSSELSVRAWGGRYNRKFTERLYGEMRLDFNLMYF